jgi:hypothetical protein
MTITPRELLETSIAQLQTLAVFLSEQLAHAGGSQRVQSAALETLACREILVSLSVLIPKLQVARCAEPPDDQVWSAKLP